ncbi:conserved hypothetical protein, partial [Hymenobacter roseosalivarius DSM 11622]
MIDPDSANKIIDETSKLAPEVYKDLAKPAVQEVGTVAGRTAKALLSPLRGLLWGWEQIEKIVEEGVKKRFEKIPEERRKTPDPEIAVPLIQALGYTAQNETLREMYLNLLANSMDKTKEKDVHPSFVELIKQMNSLDAKVFEKLSEEIGYQQIVNPAVELKNQGKFLTKATPDWFIGWTIEGYDPFDVSASFVRLSKFGLIELMLYRTVGEENYDKLKNDKYLLEI